MWRSRMWRKMIFKKLKLKYTLQIDNVHNSVLEEINNFEKKLLKLNPEGYGKLFLVAKTTTRKEINLPNDKCNIKYVVNVNELDTCFVLNNLIAELNIKDIFIKNTINFSSKPYKKSLTSIISLMTDNAGKLLIQEEIQQNVFIQEAKTFLDEAIKTENKLLIQSV